MLHRKKNLYCVPTASGAGRALPLLHCQPLSLELFLWTEKDDLVMKTSPGMLYLLDSFLPSLGVITSRPEQKLLGACVQVPGNSDFS